MLPALLQWWPERDGVSLTPSLSSQLLRWLEHLRDEDGGVPSTAYVSPAQYRAILDEPEEK